MDRPTFVTDLKLLLGGVERCYAALDRAGLALDRLPDEVKGPGCGFEDVARLERSFIPWGPSPPGRRECSPDGVGARDEASVLVPGNVLTAKGRE